MPAYRANETTVPYVSSQKVNNVYSLATTTKHRGTRNACVSLVALLRKIDRGVWIVTRLRVIITEVVRCLYNRKRISLCHC